MYRNTKIVDEEVALTQLRDLSIQHKLLLEQQQAMFGPAHVPPHVPMGITYYDQQIAELNKRLANVRRRKKRQERLRQIAAASSQATQSLLGQPSPQRRRNKKRTIPFPTVAIPIGVLIVIGLVIIGSFQAARGQQMSMDDHVAPAPLIGSAEAAVTPAALIPIESGQAAAPSLSQTASQATEQRIIGNTGGIGVRFRVEPFQDAQSYQDLPDETVVYPLDSSIDGEGTTWWRVALGSGDVGFVKERYLQKP
ncbi:MAG: hypothetical protein HGA65_01665 [Oscillochloris sp.]|nr:hypothetical protein [Oscillochloris sp.]